MCRLECPPAGSAESHTRLFGVIRHADRADGLFATIGGNVRWTQTKDGVMWPRDPPLSDTGLEEAQAMANNVANISSACGSDVHVVVTSPYLRCIQTAEAICDRLGPHVQLVVDDSVGEVYGPVTMGPTRPEHAVVRRREDTSSESNLRAVLSESAGVQRSAWPTWGEDLRAAWRRYTGRFVELMEWASQARKNVLVVSHADAVVAGLTLMPSHAGQVVESIESGGMFLANWEESERLLVSTPPWPLLQERSWSSPRVKAINFGWHVETFGMKLNSVGGDRDGTFARRTCSLARRTGIPRERIVDLLGASAAVLLVQEKRPADDAPRERCERRDLECSEGTLPKFLKGIGTSSILQRRKAGKVRS